MVLTAVLALHELCQFISNLKRYIAGLPAVALPCGFTSEAGKKLPVGMQIIGKAFGEKEIISIAHAFEQTAEFATGRPEGY